MLNQMDNKPKLYVPIVIILTLLFSMIVVNLLAELIFFVIEGKESPIDQLLSEYENQAGDDTQLLENSLINNPYFISFSVIVQALLGLLFFHLLLMKPYHIQWRDFKLTNPFTLKRLFYGILVGIVFILMVNIILSVLLPIYEELGLESKQPELYNLEGISNTALIVLGFCIVFVAPFYEELIFRGSFVYVFKQHDITESKPSLTIKEHPYAYAGILLSAGFFSLFHFDIALIIPIFLGSLFLATVYFITGDLLITMIGHSINNLHAIIMYYLYQNGYLPEMEGLMELIRY